MVRPPLGSNVQGILRHCTHVFLWFHVTFLLREFLRYRQTLCQNIRLEQDIQVLRELWPPQRRLHSSVLHLSFSGPSGSFRVLLGSFRVLLGSFRVLLWSFCNSVLCSFGQSLFFTLLCPDSAFMFASGIFDNCEGNTGNFTTLVVSVAYWLG